MRFDALRSRGYTQARKRRRWLNGLPGVASWIMLCLLIFGVITAPVTTLIFTVFLVMLTALNMLIAVVVSWRMARLVQTWAQTDWQARAAAHPDHTDIRHIVIVPNYVEPQHILERTLARIAASPITRDQVIVVLAMEGADPTAESTAAALRWRFESQFAQIITTFHPPNLPGELRGKSANLSWAARHAVTAMTQAGHAIDDLIITVADADSLLHPRYLEALTALYLEHPDRHAALWQAPIFYHGNLDSVHPLLEPMHSYSSVLQLAFLGQGFAFSTYSLSARLAADIDYWDTNVIAEDQHTFLKAYIRKGGAFALMPVYLPVAACVVTGRGLLNTLWNRYQQTIRHAWGAEEVGYAYDQLLFTQHRVPSWKAALLLVRIITDHILAVGVPLLVVIGLPALFILHPFLLTTQLPLVAALFVGLTITLITCAFLWRIDVRLRERHYPAGTLARLLSFVALPVLLLLLVTLPAFVAHTRLLFGSRPLAYRVAPK